AVVSLEELALQGFQTSVGRVSGGVSPVIGHIQPSHSHRRRRNLIGHSSDVNLNMIHLQEPSQIDSEFDDDSESWGFATSQFVIQMRN
ncbi:hypothetical protein PFISCL1PPCAC_28596, partial [Pristionchus fissidentatus]